MWNKLKKLSPILDQATTAAYNFLFVLLTSLILPTEDFVNLNYVLLTILLVINMQNAVNFQPFLKFGIESHFTAGEKKFVYKKVAALIMISIPVVLFVCLLLNIPIIISLLAGLWTLAMTLYEFNRRISMIKKNWFVNFLMGTSLNVITWGLLLLFQANSATNTMVIVVAVQLLVALFFTFINLNFIEWHNAKKEKNISPQFKKTYYSFGGMLLGGAIAFWFIGGGYLLFLGGFMSEEEVAFLRVIQNILNGIFILLTALDNFILVGEGKQMAKRLPFVNLAIMMFISIYGVISYFAIIYLYDYENIALIFAIWILFYFVMSSSKINIAILKFHGDSKSSFISQSVGAGLYILILSLIFSLEKNLSTIDASLAWIPCAIVILLYTLLHLRPYLRS